MPNNITGLPGVAQSLVNIGGDKKSAVNSASQRHVQQSPSKETGDAVSITAVAASLNALENSLKNVSVVDVNRVEQIQQALESDNYAIHAQQVADKFLEFEFAIDRS